MPSIVEMPGATPAALELFDDLGCTMIRCWGGNVYEDHAFFEHCDTHGMMVWQDFAFACAIYPQDEQFLGRVRHEATAVVRKLRNHPSLVLWSGDNEVDESYLWLGRDPGTNRITREVLPRVCAEHDPYRPYLPSSPYASGEVSGRFLAARGPERARCEEAARRLMPEQHLWGPRDYFKSPFYAETTAHFASEIGYHGCPNLSSLERFLPQDALWPWQDNDVLSREASLRSGLVPGTPGAHRLPGAAFRRGGRGLAGAVGTVIFVGVRRMRA